MILALDITILFWTDYLTRVIQQLYNQAKNDYDDETLEYYIDMQDELLASNHSFVRNMIEKLGGGLLAYFFEFNILLNNNPLKLNWRTLEKYEKFTAR